MAQELALSRGASVMGVASLILWRRDLLFTEVEKVILYKSFLERKMMTYGFLAVVCSSRYGRRKS